MLVVTVTVTVIVHAVVVAAVEGPMAVTVSKIAVTVSSIKVTVLEMPNVAERLQSWRQLLKVLCHDSIQAACHHGISCQDRRI